MQSTYVLTLNSKNSVTILVEPFMLIAEDCDVDVPLAVACLFFVRMRVACMLRMKGRANKQNDTTTDAAAVVDSLQRHLQVSILVNT